MDIDFRLALFVFLESKGHKEAEGHHELYALNCYNKK
jgi:hypothetical protein